MNSDSSLFNKGYCIKVRVGVVVINDDGILVARQNNRDFWVLPGGTLEIPENIEECAIREIKEEANLDITIERLLFVGDFIVNEKHTLDIVFLGNYVSGDFKMETSENLNDLKFVSFDEFKTMSVKPEEVKAQIVSGWPDFTDSTQAYLGQFKL